MRNLIRRLSTTEINQVAGAETRLVNHQDGLHVYMTRKDEQFEFNNIVFRPDGSVYNKYESRPIRYHFEIIEKMCEGNGQFHARIWK